MRNPKFGVQEWILWCLIAFEGRMNTVHCALVATLKNNFCHRCTIINHVFKIPIRRQIVRLIKNQNWKIEPFLRYKKWGLCSHSKLKIEYQINASIHISLSLVTLSSALFPWWAWLSRAAIWEHRSLLVLQYFQLSPLRYCEVVIWSCCGEILSAR